MNNLRHIAIHEAGHAVIGRVLTLPCGRATIKPDYATETAGLSDSGAFWKTDDEWMKRGKMRCGQHLPVARIVTLMAGAEAEIGLLGICTGGDSDDRLEIQKVLDEFGGDEDRLRKMTKMLVRRHRGLIERVAEALLTRITLSGLELDALVGRSIDDVGQNMTAEEIECWLSAQPD